MHPFPSLPWASRKKPPPFDQFLSVPFSAIFFLHLFLSRKQQRSEKIYCHLVTNTESLKDTAFQIKGKSRVTYFLQPQYRTVVLYMGRLKMRPLGDRVSEGMMMPHPPPPEKPNLISQIRDEERRKRNRTERKGG